MTAIAFALGFTLGLVVLWAWQRRRVNDRYQRELAARLRERGL